MKPLQLILSIGLLLAPLCAFAQEDADRARGLPSRIGGNRCNGAIPGSNATLSGSFNIQGAVSGEKPPVFAVAVYSNGMFVSRQRVKNGSGFNFGCLPKSGVVVIAEVNSTEVAWHPMGVLDGPPMTNRQDIFVNWTEAASVIKRRNEVVSLRDAYKRSDADQKLFDKAIEAIEKKKPDNALKLFQQIVQNDTHDFVAWFEIGNLHFAGETFADAAEAYEKSYSLADGFLPAAVGAGRASIAVKKFDRAIEVLAKADQAKQGSADVNQYLGDAYLQVKKGSLAIVHWRKAIEIAPAEKADLYLRIGALYHVAGGRKLAAEEYKKLLQLKPDHPDKEKLLKYIAENES